MVSEYKEKLKTLAIKLHEINAVKFGDFKTKSGLSSPIYFDLRVIISHPDIIVSIVTCFITSQQTPKHQLFVVLIAFCLFRIKDLLSALILEFVKEKGIEYEHICGVPYTALPIATLISNKQQKPMLIRRKEVKTYGTKKLIEGKFSVGDSCLIIEDIITSGSSILETVADLRSEGTF